MKSSSTSIDAHYVRLPDRSQSKRGDTVLMKFKKSLISVGAIALGITAFFVGRYSVQSQLTANSKQAPVSVAPTNKQEERATKMKSAPVMIYPAIPRVPAKDFIVHKGDPQDSHIQLFANSLKNVSLSPSEIQQLQDVYSSVYAARQDYEASIASVAVVSPRETLIEIPSYPAFGEKLKNSLDSMFSDILGGQKAQEVINQLESRIATSNQYWGKYSQGILTTYEPATKTYKVLRVANVEANKPTDFSVASESRVWPDQLLEFSKFRPMLPKAE